jgi:gamma-glutamylcyclotransferase (GGCT)/AIG2-like uncharacterized protein YtfP
MENLFSYGTLQNGTVQKETFGRLLNGLPDLLEGYNLSMIKIEDQSVVATSGKTHHPIIQFTDDKTDTIKGMVFEITESELKQADEYEVDEYKRTLVKLKSGKNAWVYVSSS